MSARNQKANGSEAGKAGKASYSRNSTTKGTPVPSSAPIGRNGGLPAPASKIRKAIELPQGWSTYPHTVSGYRVNYGAGEASRSVFQGNHNEFWMIWTDVAPGILFVIMFVVALSSPGFSQRPLFERWLVAGVFVSCIMCRAGSSIFHVYNCLSLRFNQTLIYVDLLGISCMAFGSPWIYAVASRSESFGDPDLMVYLCILGATFAACIGTFSVGLLRGAKLPWFWLPLLVAHAAVGNFPGLKLAIDPGFPGIWRAFSLVGVMGFLVGYIFFYSLNVPERWMKPGTADGKWWNSHVIWHMCGVTSQLFYILSTFLPMPRLS